MATAKMIAQLQSAYLKGVGKASTLSDDQVSAMVDGQASKKKDTATWLALMVEEENLQNDEGISDDDDADIEDIEEESKTGEDTKPKGEDVAAPKSKTVTAIVRKDAVDAASKLAADAAFERDMRAGVAAGKVKRRVAALVALHVRRIFGQDNIMGILPVPGSKAADRPAGSNAPYDLGAKVGEPGWYRSAATSLPWVAVANKRLGYVNLLLSKESATLPDTPEDIKGMSRAELLDEQKDLQDDVSGAVSQFRTAARILHRIHDVKELGLVASIRMVKKADGTFVVPKGIQPIRVSHKTTDEDGEIDQRDRYFTVGAFLSVKLENVAKAEDKFAAFLVERKPRTKAGKDTGRTIEIRDVVDADMATAEFGHFFGDASKRAEFLASLLKDDSDDLVLSLFTVGTQFARYMSNPKVQERHRAAVATKAARDKASDAPITKAS